MFKKLFGKGETPKNSDSNRPPLPTKFEPLQDMAFHHTQALMAAHQGSWRLGEGDQWAVDLAAGEIRWTFPDGKLVRAPGQLIATWNSADDTFLWGWDHPSAPPGSAVAAAAAKAHADAHAIEELQISKVSCSMEDGWQLAAIAVLLGDLQGVYRGQASETAWAYIGFGNVTISKV